MVFSGNVIWIDIFDISKRYIQVKDVSFPFEKKTLKQSRFVMHNSISVLVPIHLEKKQIVNL